MNFFQDGWESGHEEETVETQEELQEIKFKGEKGRSILKSNQHSLEPDMISGWKPKLPSCPLPLSYRNVYVDSLLCHLKNDDTYKIVYVGPRYSNSVQVNKQYSYPWRYRNKYNLNLDAVQEAVRKVGVEENVKIPLTQAEHHFDSAFESGNLDLAVRVKKNEYDCFMRSDTNTKGHTNWYYFKVTSSQPGPMKINICNMTKHRNLYSKGMKPYVKIGEEGIWSQNNCLDVVFVERYCRYGLDKKTNQLQFTFQFTKANQSAYFAYSVPYTYSDLEQFLNEIKNDHPLTVQRSKLCETLGGVDVPLVTITNTDFNCSESDQIKQQSVNSRKKGILVSARIHPGESNSSHVLEGFVRELLKNTQGSNILRSMFVFYIVPMLNPDGVIAGNFRTSFSGKDLNRQFNNLNKYVFPEVTALCQYTQQLKKLHTKGIEFYFDFHGHSAKKNLFCYGPEHPPSKMQYFKSRAYAKILQKTSPIFSYRKSIFTVSECKKNTGRAYMLKTARIPMTFAFEISNGIYEDQNKKDIYLNRNILLNAGEIVVRGLFRFAQQLEMKIPSKFVTAKVDTGKKDRFLKSAGASRKGELNKKTIYDGTLYKGLKNKSVEKSNSQDRSRGEKNNQFIDLIQEIKKDEKQIKEVEIEGGSDSESSGDDLSKDELKQLFDQIQRRNREPSTYIIRSRKKVKTLRILGKRLENQEQNIENNCKEQNVNENAKIRSNRLIEMSRPPMVKGGKRGISVEFEKKVLTQKNFTLVL